MRVYGIKRKADKVIVFSSASRTITLYRFNNFYGREFYRFVILER